MRRFRHWTLRYVVARFGTIVYERAHPDHPWLTSSANAILQSCLRKTDIGLEFGSGRSTVWLAKRVAHVTSIEHDVGWGDKVRQMLTFGAIKNVDYKVIPEDEGDQQGSDAAYTRAADSIGNGALDFCLVDGIYRDECVLRVLEKIRPGGILIIDNVNRYLPSNSVSPHSRSLSDGPNGARWAEAYRELSSWRRIWTSSGVTDTAIFIKPCS